MLYGAFDAAFESVWGATWRGESGGCRGVCMGGGARDCECDGDDGFDTANRNNVAAVVIWRDEYDIYFVRTWARFATFVLY